MHSIRTMITTFTISAILVCSLLIGAVSVLTVKNEEGESSEQLMNAICEAKCDRINYYLNSIEDSADLVSRFIYDSLDVIELSEGNVIGASGSGRSLNKRERTQEQIERMDQYLGEHLQEVEAVFDTVANNNTSITSYYYRINPEMSEEAGGFWFSRQNVSRFKRMSLTPINLYQPDDFSHVGWYYQTLERGRPSWIDPYYNGNIKETVVSYTVPIYKYGTFIGIIGMDVSYMTLIEQVSKIQVLETGYAFLTDAKGEILYHPQLENGLLLDYVIDETREAEKDDATRKLISYSLNGQKRKAAWGALSSGMRMFVSAPTDEINAGWRSLTRFIVIALGTIVIIVIILTLMLMKRITDPLEQLEHASKQVTEGNYDIHLNYQGNDELGTLTKAFNQMAMHLQTFIHDLNSKAYRDALTGVRNKGAFDIFKFKINDMVKNTDVQERPDFAIAMFDCNDLKVINDTYGHDKGDAYLMAACKLICKVFTHSPVFRIGGDEFAVIMQQEDMIRRHELEQEFINSINQNNSAVENPWDKVNIAYGMADFDPYTDKDVESVVRRADEHMYDKKKEMKGGRVR